MKYGEFKEQLVKMGKPSPFLDLLLSRQEAIMSGKHKDCFPVKPDRRQAEVYASNRAKIERSDPFAYGRAKAHAQLGIRNP